MKAKPSFHPIFDDVSSQFVETPAPSASNSAPSAPYPALGPQNEVLGPQYLTAKHDAKALRLKNAQQRIQIRMMQQIQDELVRALQRYVDEYEFIHDATHPCGDSFQTPGAQASERTAKDLLFRLKRK